MNVLFLCTGNSARSILGEVIFNEKFSAHGRAYSAGSKPLGQPNPLALEVLQKHGYGVDGLSSQNVSEYAEEGALVMDVVISVCDSAANDCPVWPGQGTPERLHWSLPDPETLEDFEAIYQELTHRLEAWLNSR